MTRIVKALFHAALALVCQRENVTPADVLRHDPSRKASRDPAWRRAARLRWRAIALINQGLDVPQNELALALGVTPAAICFGMQKLEDERSENPTLDQAMDEMERILRGECDASILLHVDTDHAFQVLPEAA